VAKDGCIEVEAPKPGEAGLGGGQVVVAEAVVEAGHFGGDVAGEEDAAVPPPQERDVAAGVAGGVHNLDPARDVEGVTVLDADLGGDRWEGDGFRTDEKPKQDAIQETWARRHGLLDPARPRDLGLDCMHRGGRVVRFEMGGTPEMVGMGMGDQDVGDVGGLPPDSTDGGLDLGGVLLEADVHQGQSGFAFVDEIYVHWSELDLVQAWE